MNLSLDDGTLNIPTLLTVATAVYKVIKTRTRRGIEHKPCPVSATGVGKLWPAKGIHAARQIVNLKENYQAMLINILNMNTSPTNG